MGKISLVIMVLGLAFAAGGLLDAVDSEISISFVGTAEAGSCVRVYSDNRQVAVDDDCLKATG